MHACMPDDMEASGNGLRSCLSRMHMVAYMDTVRIFEGCGGGREGRGAARKMLACMHACMS